MKNSLIILTSREEFFLPLVKDIEKRKNCKIKIKKFNYINTDGAVCSGGGGMIFRIDKAYQILEEYLDTEWTILIPSPHGQMINEISLQEKNIIFCPRFSGFDERILKLGKNIKEVSIGPYVVSSGEIAGMIIIDFITRKLYKEGYNSKAIKNESFSLARLIKEDQYSLPRKFLEMEVPQILLSGDHEKIKKHNQKNSLLKTFKFNRRMYWVFVISFFEAI